MKSYLKTLTLLGILSVLFILVGFAIGGTSGAILAFFISLIINFFSYFFSEKIALSANHASLLPRENAPQLYSIVEDLSSRYNIPTPKIYITPSLQANAFATGRDPKHSSIAVTQGLLNILDIKEIQGVLAHELGHIKNRDILLTTIAAVLASSISFLANMALWGGYSNNRGRNNNDVLGILSIILMPIAATLLQLAVSRQREYSADMSGAEILGTGQPLANALLAIENSTHINPISGVNPSYSSMYISNPLGKSNVNFKSLFSTHPPTPERIKRLLSLRFKNV